MKSGNQGRALVTGAARGIGGAITLALAAKGWEVVGTCRNPKKLAASDRVEGVRYLPLDLENERSVAKLLASVGDVDLLVNNAGASPVGAAEEAPLDRVRALFQVNLFGPMLLTQGVIAGMRRRRRGTVIFIGSMRGEGPTPFSSLYSASKAAIRSFAECARMEVAGFGVNVVVVAPWHVRTTLPQERMYAEGSPYFEAVSRVKATRDRKLDEAPDPGTVADCVMKVLSSRKPRSLYVVGQPVFTFLLKHLPRSLVEAMSMRLYSPKE